jgi:hypothetical protein
MNQLLTFRAYAPIILLHSYAPSCHDYLWESVKKGTRSLEENKTYIKCLRLDFPGPISLMPLLQLLTSSENKQTINLYSGSTVYLPYFITPFKVQKKMLGLSSKLTTSFQKKKGRVSLLFQYLFLYLKTSTAEKERGLF